MSITLYDLCGGDTALRFSPYCWRAKMALAHKGIESETVPTRFTDIPKILGGGHKRVPVIVDGAQTVEDSWAIAQYLETAYSQQSSLFGGSGGQAATKLIEQWANTTLHPAIARVIVANLITLLDPADREYFRTSREKMFGETLEAVSADPEAKRKALKGALTPLRIMLRSQPFVGGQAPLYGDYILFGTLQWARTTAPIPVLAEDDPIGDWLNLCLDLFDGLGRSMPAAAG